MSTDNLEIIHSRRAFGIMHFFCGSGGGALGFAKSRRAFRGVEGAFETLGGIDSDALCCEDFERLTGVPATVMDLFDRQMYTNFWGKEPPPAWREATAADVLAASGGKCPDVVFLSPPCKGFSGLLPEKSANLPKYQALNRLVPRSMQLAMEAYAADLPAVILIENVPRITKRGAALLKEVRALLAMHGYEFTSGTHDCGELGGLGQTRKRFLLIARNPKKLQSFIYEPPKLRLKSIGDVLGSLPAPGDTTAAGAMHRLPQLQWKTWVRLALIPAGKDWRALNSSGFANTYRIVPWGKPGPTVTGAIGALKGAINVSDPRCNFRSGSQMKVTAAEDPAPTVTGSRVGSGAVLVADKLDYAPRPGAFRVVRWDEVSPTITAATRAGGSNGVSGVSDPRLDENTKHYSRKFKIEDWKQPSRTACCDTDIQTGALAVNDPRTECTESWNRTSVSRAQDWTEPSGTIIGKPNLHGAGASIFADPRIPYTAFNRALKLNGWDGPATAITSGNSYVADPQRLACKARAGAYGVLDWDEPSKMIPGNFDVDNRPAVVADPRPVEPDGEADIPEDAARGVWMIIAEDGSWHRPITTFEMAMLQSLPPTFPDGSPLVLAGTSESRWREHIGNMVPPDAAEQMGNAILDTMLPNMVFDEWHWNFEPDARIWVRPGMERYIRL